jgi:hypothetical protein
MFFELSLSMAGVSVLQTKLFFFLFSFERLIRHDDETYISKMGKNHESLYINRSKMVPVYIHGPSTLITEAKSPDIDEPLSKCPKRVT